MKLIDLNPNFCFNKNKFNSSATTTTNTTVNNNNNHHHHHQIKRSSSFDEFNSKNFFNNHSHSQNLQFTSNLNQNYQNLHHNHQNHQNQTRQNDLNKTLKKTKSQPNLSQDSLEFNHYHHHHHHHHSQNLNLNQTTKSNHLNNILNSDLQTNPSIIKIPRKSSPWNSNHHRNSSISSSSINNSHLLHHHHHLNHLSFFNRHHSIDDQDDEIQIEGGINSLLTHSDLNQNKDSESGDSSAIGEPMLIDTESKNIHLGPRVVKRKHVNRNNLLPRPKAHLRVAAQLSSEEVSPDLLTEAEVHRRFKSIPFVVPQPSSSTPTTHSNTTPSNSPLIPRTPSSPFHAHKPTPNRFPEQVDEDQVEIGLEEKSSDSDGPDDHHSFGSGPYHSIIMAQEDDGEDQKIMEIQKWKTFRGSGSSSSSGAIDQTRSGKRRCQEPERYDHGIFKRRAVSPSTSLSSSCIGSPILNPSSAALILPNHLNSSYNNMLSNNNNNNNNNINPINLSKSNRSNLNQNNSVTSKSKMDEDCSSNHQVDTLMLNQ